MQIIIPASWLSPQADAVHKAA